MKELTIEQKAKAYDEALKRAIKHHDRDGLTLEQYETIDIIFPELKESKESKDERIRKALISVLKSDFEKDTTIYDISVGNIIAWLEKQGEVESDNDDIEVEEKGIREAFNKIEDEKQGEQKSQRMISAEAKEAMYDKPADKVEPKCEESKTKIFDAPTPFEDKLYAFVAACEFLAIPSKIEFILEHSQEILDAAKEQIGKEQSSTWNEEDERLRHSCIAHIEDELEQIRNDKYGHSEIISDLKESCRERIKWLESLKDRYTWKPSDEQMADLWNMLCECRPADHQLLQDIYYGLKKLRDGKL